jgi:hypothetical protein
MNGRSIGKKYSRRNMDPVILWTKKIWNINNSPKNFTGRQTVEGVDEV